MQRFLFRFCVLLAVMLTSILSVNAQEPDTTKPTSIDPNLLAWQNATRAKEYTITAIRTSGINFLDTAIVVSISGLQVGDKILHPGGDNFSRAVQNLWRQKLFSNIQIFVTKIQDDNIEIEISVTERPRLGNFHFKGIKKTEQEELLGKLGLAKQTIITENTRRNAVEAIEKFYAEKGFANVKVDIVEKADTAFVNSNSLTFIIDKGKKVKVNDINFFGNETVSDLKLKKQMKGTKEQTRLTLHSSDSTVYGQNTRITFSEYLKDKGYLSLSKTKNYLDPWARFKLFSSAKFDQKKYEEDKQKIIRLL